MSEPDTRAAADNPIDERIVALVRWKATSLIGRAGLTRQDRPDLEQELTARLLGPLKKFDRARGKRLSYARTLVDRFALNLLRDRRAAKRDGAPFEPLPAEEPAAGAEPDVALALDVAAAVAALPEHLRRVAEALMTQTVTGAARTLGISRATVYARVREIRERIEFRELGDNS